MCRNAPLVTTLATNDSNNEDDDGLEAVTKNVIDQHQSE
jgi:hypothetical protein